MQSNATKKQEQVTSTTHGRTVSDRARRIMGRTRYQAPAIKSYPISGQDQTGPITMMGQQTGSPE
ncbi:hypothetical protein SAMN04488125_1426 [Methylorubrum salsuginis]|uniref:Uncharacterized protein n=1 Tax=Methylorubrum salsuginis TaxID=414703 RepID=A0A1I4MPF6_9HYPH|nr:hypothetical protein SAMN04488125_1426 [Methylorubrum salsuginis]